MPNNILVISPMKFRAPLHFLECLKLFPINSFNNFSLAHLSYYYWLYVWHLAVFPYLPCVHFVTCLQFQKKVVIIILSTGISLQCQQHGGFKNLNEFKWCVPCGYMDRRVIYIHCEWYLFVPIALIFPYVMSCSTLWLHSIPPLLSGWNRVVCNFFILSILQVFLSSERYVLRIPLLQSQHSASVLE